MSTTEIKMPQMGESIAEGTLTRWFKQPGDAIKRDEPLFEISTDKVDAEIPAPADGILQEIKVEEGTTVEVNTVVALLGDGSGGGSTAVAAPAETASKAAEPSSAAKAPAKTAAAPSQAAATESSPRPAAPQSDNGTASASDLKKTRSSPLVRRIAREHGIDDLSAISGTGIDGRVTKDDILAYVKDGPSAAPATSSAPSRAAASAPVAHADPLPQLGLSRGNSSVESMTTMRKKIAEHMIHSKRTSAHVHSVFEADMTKIVKLREANKKSFEARHGVKLTYMTFFVKACCDALRKYPWMNASLDGDEILVHQSVNMGIAVSLEGGLIVPVIQGADELNVVGLQKRITDLANRSRNKGLLPNEVQGGTFTITNPGQFGGLYGIPIINQPQVAILGLGGIEKRPVVIEGDAIAVRSMVYMCIGYDHRLVDGALADQFMAQLKQNLENWNEPI